MHSRQVIMSNSYIMNTSLHQTDACLCFLIDIRLHSNICILLNLWWWANWDEGQDHIVNSLKSTQSCHIGHFHTGDLPWVRCCWEGQGSCFPAVLRHFRVPTGFSFSAVFPKPTLLCCFRKACMKAGLAAIWARKMWGELPPKISIAVAFHLVAATLLGLL